MKLALSSIAWTNEEEPMVAEKMREMGIKYVEIAPTKIWPDLTVVTADQAKEYVNWWAKYDITIVAFQSILFARPDLKIFESDDNRQQALDYLSSVLRLAGTMGVKKLVFGSPKNRQRGEMLIKQADTIAINFFNKLGDVSSENNAVLCLEPNAKQYNCDFIVNASEGHGLVRRVNNAGFGLHLDTACMALAGDNLGVSIVNAKDILEHFHISSPMLEQVEYRDDVDHISAAKALKDIKYDKVISIEMKPGEAGTNVERVEKAIKFARSIYLGT